MNSRKLVTAWSGVLLLSLLAAWLMVAPQRAEAQYAYSCSDFMRDVLDWCDSYQGTVVLLPPGPRR